MSIGASSRARRPDVKHHGPAKAESRGGFIHPSQERDSMSSAGQQSQPGGQKMPARTRPGGPSREASTAGANGPLPRPLAPPVFAQPAPTPDPAKFRVKHPSDTAAYKAIDELN